MKTKRFRMLACAIGLGMAFSGMATLAAEAPPPVLLENFACTYNEGQDQGDLMAARDYMVSQAAKADLALPPSYVWHSFKGGPGMDHIWFTVHQSLADFAAASEAFAAASEMSGVEARFEKVAACESNIAMARPIFQGSEAGQPGGQSFINANACMYREGVGEDGMMDFVSHVNMALGGMSEYNETTIIAATPMTQSPGSADVYIFSVNKTPSSWAAGLNALQSSEDGASLSRHFRTILDCGGSLWTSEQVVGGEEGS